MANDKAEVEQGMKEIVKVMREIGIVMQKWGSNCSDKAKVTGLRQNEHLGRWWKGPGFLRRLQFEWPEQLKIRSTESAMAKTRDTEEISQNIIMKTDSELDSRTMGLVEKLLRKGTGLCKTIRSLVVLAGLLQEKI